MHRIVSIAVAVAIVGHLWFGCCSRHVHVAGKCESETVRQHSHHGHVHHQGDHQHGHHHHHAAADGQHAHPLLPNGPAVPHHHCQNNDCTMLPAGKVLLPEVMSLVGCVVEISSSPAALLAAAGTSFTEPLFAPHVRSHLAHRVLRV